MMLKVWFIFDLLPALPAGPHLPLGGVQYGGQQILRERLKQICREQSLVETKTILATVNFLTFQTAGEEV